MRINEKKDYTLGNINILSNKYFESYANEIISKFQRMQELTKHPVASGDYHEEVLRSLLRNFLTNRFSVKTGFIRGMGESVSNQIDILIIDEMSPAAYLFQDGQFAVVTPESVVAAIEVKTHMNLNAFKQSVINLVSVKEQSGNTSGITTLAFGYDGTKGSHAVFNNWFDNVNVRSEMLLPDVFMLFNSSRLFLRYDNEFKDGRKYRTFEIDDSSAVSNLGWQLSVFVATIMAACEDRDKPADTSLKAKLRKSIPQNLAQAQGGTASSNYYSFWVGSHRQEILRAERRAL
jgi:hypothetical protein